MYNFFGNNQQNDATSGAMNGFMAGMSTGNPYVAVGGAILGGIGGALGNKSKKKAEERRKKLMMEGLNQFKEGSKDAFGNKLSANSNGLWSYDLNNSTKNGVSGVNRALNNLGNYRGDNYSKQLRNGLNALSSANQKISNANMANALKNAQRSGSNLSYLYNSGVQRSLNSIKDNYINAINNANNWRSNNANTVSQLSNAVSSSMTPIQNVQSNLQNMVNTLNKSVMNQYNNLANNTTSMSTGQDVANNFQGFGGMLSAYNDNLKRQQNYDKLLEILASRGAL